MIPRTLMALIFRLIMLSFIGFMTQSAGSGELLATAFWPLRVLSLQIFAMFDLGVSSCATGLSAGTATGTMFVYPRKVLYEWSCISLRPAGAGSESKS